jgi:hypothetical protein
MPIPGTNVFVPMNVSGRAEKLPFRGFADTGAAAPWAVTRSGRGDRG